MDLYDFCGDIAGACRRRRQRIPSTRTSFDAAESESMHCCQLNDVRSLALALADPIQRHASLPTSKDHRFLNHPMTKAYFAANFPRFGS